MEIKHTIVENKGVFFIEEDGERVAEMTYVMAGNDKMIIDHTEVSGKFEGKGLGKLLLAEAVSFSRKNKIKIMPLCPFARAVFDKTNEYTDVLF